MAVSKTNKQEMEISAAQKHATSRRNRKRVSAEWAASAATPPTCGFLRASNCLAQAQNAREAMCLPAVQAPPSESQTPHFGLNQRRFGTKKMPRGCFLILPERYPRRHRIQESNKQLGLRGRLQLQSPGTIRVPKGKDEESEMHLWRESP